MKGERKEEGSRFPVSSSSLFFLLTSSKEKGEKASVYRGWDGLERGRIAYTIVTFVTAAGLGYFFIFSTVKVAKNGSFLEGERGWRGERRGPWGRILKVMY